MSGVDRLVPPTLRMPPRKPKLSDTSSPLASAASAEMSATVRMRQCPSCCHDGFGIHAEQPLLPYRQAVSRQPRGEEGLRTRRVPPTAMTLARTAGKLAGPEP